MNTYEDIEKLNKEAKEALRKFSLLEDAENILKEHDLDTWNIYQAKSIYSNRFVNIMKKIEELQDYLKNSDL